jgi:hypothetical protein
LKLPEKPFFDTSCVDATSDSVDAIDATPGFIDATRIKKRLFVPFQMRTRV